MPPEIASGLTWPVVAAVLLGAVLHAGWNALVKSSGDKPLDTALVHFLGAVVALPMLLAVGLPRPETVPYIAASLTIHVGYYIALAGAYQHGEFGVTYPIMRGFAPMLVALGSLPFLGEAPSVAAWAGIAGITLGVALVGLSHPGEALHHGKALAFAFANAAIIALYTIVDGRGVRTEVAAGGTSTAFGSAGCWSSAFTGATSAATSATGSAGSASGAPSSGASVTRSA